MEQYNSPDEKPWVPILKPRKSGVVAYGKFAVEEYNRSSNASLEFKSVLQGAQRKIGGRKYTWLDINTSNGKYRADMYGWGGSKGHKVLISFNKLNY
ncbi:Cysteine proteinase inhibitor 5 [Striga hermonthica]|uniref:Cysteine proteinase inhibitor 5 n=1 Tax=Striga hermonthica TaxID=68872 RepID=A0A9N7NTA1_STRHE|nr:Cysteine proteinase inhibitor 5 [Striga hermonthica]